MSLENSNVEKNELPNLGLPSLQKTLSRSQNPRKGLSTCKNRYDVRKKEDDDEASDPDDFISIFPNLFHRDNRPGLSPTALSVYASNPYGASTAIEFHNNPFEDLNPFEAHKDEDVEEASVADDDEFEHRIPVPDEHGHLTHCPGDEKRAEQKDIQPMDSEMKKERPHSIATAGVESFKYLYSMALLVFSVVVVMAAILSGQTIGTANIGVPPVLAFFFFWFLIIWLAMMEGGQGCLVGLQPIDSFLYKETHPRTFKNTSIVHKGDNMERFILGRQFLVVLVVFVSSLMSSAVSNVDVFGLPEGIQSVFLNSGVALMLITIMVGQLTAQVNAAKCMLDFINNYFMLYFVTYVSLALEFSGLLHSVYLVQIVFSIVSGKPIESSEPPRTTLQNLFFGGRVLFSLGVLAFAFAVTLSALFDGKTTMWESVPSAVSVLIFFILMCFVGLMEGMQIALFAVVNLPDEELKKHSIAQKVCEWTFRDQNLQAFLIGRQICVTICMFVVARVTTLNVKVGQDNNIFGVSDGVQNFFNTGLLGALITTIVASLAWRIIASSFPVAFLSNPLIYLILRLCLLIEDSGVCSASWVLARWNKIIFNFQPDEVHLEGAEPQTAEPMTRREKDIDRFVTGVRLTYSLTLLVFSIIMVMAALFTEQTTSTQDIGIHPALAFVIFWFLIIWLAMMEGGQGCLVGLRPVDEELYAASHCRTLKNTSMCHRGVNLERFIVGRQFLVVLVVFVSNLMTSSVPGATVLGLPESVNSIFLASGFSLILITIILGQLTAQINSANCMLDFINNYFMLYFVTYVSLAIEMSGLLHSVYLVQIVLTLVSGKHVDSSEPPRTGFQMMFFWSRVLFSLGVLAFAFAVTLSALFNGKTAMWEGVPYSVSVVIFFFLMCLVGVMEGMQIALFAVINLPEEELKHHALAHRVCDLAFRDQNLQAFLIGRQICVTICMFVVARITTLNITVGEDENIFGVSDGVQMFFNTGLLGALITTIVASLIWRVFAASFPITFLSNPLVAVITRFCLVLEASGICSAAWVFGRWNKLLAGYQPDEVYLEGCKRHGKKPVTRRDKDIDVTVTLIQYCYSMGLLIFSIVIVMSLISSEQTLLSQETSRAVAFSLIWFLMLWVSMMEGGQGDLVGLQPVDRDLYKESHPLSAKSTEVAHKGDNMERFIAGRQFLVVLGIFVTNLSGAALPDSSILGMPDALQEIFVDSGIALMLMTIIIGQLTAQINAANCMLDFLNNYFVLYFVTYASLAIEMSGLLHCVYLVQIAFSKITGAPVESCEPPRSGLQNLFFWGRVTFSLAVLSFAFAVTLSALFAGKTTMWNGVPPAASVALFLVLMFLVGMMEGVQIALFAVVNLPEKNIIHHTIAKANCELAFDGNNLQAFLIGRQICVTACMFIFAKITTVNIDIGNDDNIFGVSDGVQKFFNTGLLGAVITTIVGSLAWRILASTFPLTFLSNPLIYLIIRLCLLLEASGVCSAAWLLALIHKQIAGYQPDEVYIGTPEQRFASREEAREAAGDLEVLANVSVELSV